MNAPLDQIFHSLADSTRRDILKRIAQEEMSVGEIAEPYDMSMAAVSKHLKVLEKAQLIRRRRDGKHFVQTVNLEPLKEVDEWIAFYRKFWQDAFDRMDDYLTNLQEKIK